MANRVVEILCRRDGMEPKDAQALVDQTIAEINDNLGDPDAVEDIIMNNLGLEMDYIFDLLY